MYSFFHYKPTTFQSIRIQMTKKSSFESYFYVFFENDGNIFTIINTEMPSKPKPCALPKMTFPFADHYVIVLLKSKQNDTRLTLLYRFLYHPILKW